MNARSLSGINDVTSNGDVALTMNARSMSGINDTLGGGGDVFKAGNPNTFTGTNTFNTNRPTSNLTSTPSSTDFITKADGDTLYTNNTGDALLAGGTEASPQTFTEFNKFDKLTIFELTRPKHIVPQGSPAQTPVDADFITKVDGDELYGSLSGSARLAGGDEGDPQIFTGENLFEADIVFEGAITQNDTGSVNLITQTATGSTINIFSQSGSNSAASINSITQVGANSTFNTDGTIQANGDITSLGLRGTTDQDGELLQFINATGNYPRFVIQGANDANVSIQLGRHGSSGNGYLRCANNGSSANGIFLLGNGSSYIMGGNLGIGTTSPSYKLHVIGTVSLEGGGGAYVRLTGTNMRLTGGSSSYLLFQNGGHHIDTYSANGAGRRFYINYYNNQGVTLTRVAVTSDDRIKEAEKFIENATDTLLKLRPQTYIKYAPIPDGSSIKPNFDLSGNFESGLIAQEIYYDAPELRHIVEIEDDKGDKIIPSSDDPQKDPDYSDWGDMPAGVDYIQLIPYLIKSNQELHQRISILEAKINEL